MKTKSVLLRRVVGSFVVLFIVFSSHRAMADCSLTPVRATNTVGAVHGVTAHVTGTNGLAAPGVVVSFAIQSGPNAGTNGTATTSAGGDAIFNYAGNGGVGTDILQATGVVDGVVFSCLSTQVWVAAGTAPSIQCPAPVVTAANGDSCSASVAFAVVASGSPMPTVRHRIGSDAISSPHLFPAGTTTVTSTASNASGTASCTFTVTVTESVPPEITCPNDVFQSVTFGETNAVVEFELPAVTDNCSDVTVVCDPPSGSLFPLGTTFVTCTATDSSSNVTSCSFGVTVEETQPEAHDMAILKIKAPRFINLNAASSAFPKRVVVTIQNRSAHTETIFDSVRFESLVTLAVQSLDTNLCADLGVTFLQRPPQRRLPFSIKPKKTVNLYFEVTFGCAVNSAKGPGQEDFRYVARVNHAAIDDVADTHPECDVCPRLPLEGGVDPNPNGRIKDKGCGAPLGNGMFGNDVLTDVFVR